MNAPIPLAGLITLDLADLDANGPFQQRRTRASAEADAGLVESIRTMGVLQPILVRHDDATGQHQVVDGHRRVEAARAAGLATIAAIEVTTDERITMAAGVAANLQRAPLAPVDQWRAIVHLQSLGWSLAGAALALGTPMRLARQLDKLGRLHPDMLAAIEAHDMPEEDEIAEIAGAPIEAQEAALKVKNAWFGKPRESEPNWYVIANACQVKRISRALAIFDPAKVEGITWDEDLFAQPDDKDAVTTRDIDAFLEAQHAALVARAQRKKTLHAAEWNAKNNSPRIPSGWTPCWDHKRAGVEQWAAVARSGYDLGKVVTVHCLPPATKAKQPEAEARKESPPDSGAAQSAEADASARDDAGEPDDTGSDAESLPDSPEEILPVAPPTKSRPPVTERGRILIAQAKTTAIRCALRDRRDHQPEELLAILVLAIAAKNVTVRGDPGSAYTRTRFTDLAARLVGPDGDPCWHPGEVLAIAAEAAARMIVCGPTGRTDNDGGDAAEWIGIGLDAARDMPRLDTEEILATVTGDALKAAAIALGDAGKGTTKALRARLVGNAEGLVLPGSRFEAKGPPRADKRPEGHVGPFPCAGCSDPECCIESVACERAEAEDAGAEEAA